MRIFLTCLAAAALASASYAADAKAGKEVYDKSCKGCHGVDGAPNAAIAKMLKVDMKDLKAPEVQAESDDVMKNIVTAGKGKMKPMPAIAGASLDNVVAYTKSLKK